jgi:hypothetical protein
MLAHELGHVIGLDHAELADDATDTQPGVRRLPSEATIDRLFTEIGGTV